ncbi:hypothetical protein QTP70_002932 [Hemibagrus guttatus]|uniref:Ig-like domain-containing protein n=1 Tax=Hemibagrus guttatus TaxID=175788 RepID=A0AAE0R855_9TELE|nr:hypothetical protein QTP70_002932 [Hemibagrus guttatus]KAK3566611.1 hypothetical protein QTP86_001492 [Hemibagrus guttatus]
MIGEVFCNGAPPKAEVFGSIRRTGDRGRAKTESKTGSKFDGDVILESPVHPVTEGHPLTLRCLYHNPNPSNLRADFYKDGSVLQNQTTGEMIIQTVSKTDGFYHCKHPDRGESPKSWLSVRRPSGVEAPFSVLMLICSVVTASPYLLVTFILLLICYRARGVATANHLSPPIPIFCILNTCTH